jgi:hypothetical protein
MKNQEEVTFENLKNAIRREYDHEILNFEVKE